MRVIQRALTFDDVLLVPAHSKVLPRDVSLQTRLTRNITLNIPLLSAAMDTVTEARLAIAIAQEGGIGIVHKNLPPRAQAAEIAKVKRFESGVLKDPITITPSMSVREVLALTQQHKISGLPVLEGRKVVGIVTNRDLRFETNLDQPVTKIMTPRERLVTVKERWRPCISIGLSGCSSSTTLLNCAASLQSRISRNPPNIRMHARTTLANCALGPRSVSAKGRRSGRNCWPRRGST
jgi:IMP dehydrogenase/GMP reductase